MKKIVLNVPQELSKDKASNDPSATAAAASGGFGLIEPVVQPVEVQGLDIRLENQPDQFITIDELKGNRLNQDGTFGPSFSICLSA